MCELPGTGKVESEVKLANGKAAKVSRVYLVRGVSYEVRWFFLDVL